MNNLKKSVGTAIICIIAIFFIGIIGYHFIEGWNLLDSIYMMVITFSTIGYGEVKGLSSHGRIFTMFLILFGVGTGAYMMQGIARLIIEGDLRKMLEQQKLQRQLDKLKEHYIVCGYGKIGKVIVLELIEASIPFVIIDKDGEVCNLTLSDYISYKS